MSKAAQSAEHPVGSSGAQRQADAPPLYQWRGAMAAVLWQALLQVVDVTYDAAAQHCIWLRGVLDLHAHTCLWLWQVCAEKAC